MGANDDEDEVRMPADDDTHTKDTEIIAFFCARDIFTTFILNE